MLKILQVFSWILEMKSRAVAVTNGVMPLIVFKKFVSVLFLSTG